MVSSPSFTPTTAAASPSTFLFPGSAPRVRQQSFGESGMGHGSRASKANPSAQGGGGGGSSSSSSIGKDDDSTHKPIANPLLANGRSSSQTRARPSTSTSSSSSSVWMSPSLSYDAYRYGPTTTTTTTIGTTTSSSGSRTTVAAVSSPRAVGTTASDDAFDTETTPPPPPPKASLSLGTSTRYMDVTTAAPVHNTNNDAVPPLGSETSRPVWSHNHHNNHHRTSTAPANCWVLVYGITVHTDHRALRTSLDALGEIVEERRRRVGRGGTTNGHDTVLAVRYASALEAAKAACHPTLMVGTTVCGVQALSDHDPLLWYTPTTHPHHNHHHSTAAAAASTTSTTGPSNDSRRDDATSSPRTRTTHGSSHTIHYTTSSHTETRRPRDRREKDIAGSDIAGSALRLRPTGRRLTEDDILRHHHKDDHRRRRPSASICEAMVRWFLSME